MLKDKHFQKRGNILYHTASEQTAGKKGLILGAYAKPGYLQLWNILHESNKLNKTHWNNTSNWMWTFSPTIVISSWYVKLAIRRIMKLASCFQRGATCSNLCLARNGVLMLPPQCGFAMRIMRVCSHMVIFMGNMISQRILGSLFSDTPI